MEIREAFNIKGCETEPGHGNFTGDDVNSKSPVIGRGFMPDDKLFDLPPFTSAWGFVINNVGIYDFVLGWLVLQSISEDHKRAVARRLTGSQGAAKVSPSSRGCRFSKD